MICPVCTHPRVLEDAVETAPGLAVHVALSCFACRSTWRAVYRQYEIDMVEPRGQYAAPLLFDDAEEALEAWAWDEEQAMLTDGYGRYAVGYYPQLAAGRVSWTQISPEEVRALTHPH
jgi:hypothetical protein